MSAISCREKEHGFLNASINPCKFNNNFTHYTPSPAPMYVLDTLSLGEQGGINVCIGFPTNERCSRGQAGNLLPAGLEHARAGALR